MLSRLVVALLTLSCLAPAYARGSHSGSFGHASHSYSSPSVPRDSNGRIHRSAAAKDEFKRSHPCPATGSSSGTCSGYVIDHVTPLKRGGADSPSNMQWQTKDAAKAKDKWE